MPAQKPKIIAIPPERGTTANPPPPVSLSSLIFFPSRPAGTLLRSTPTIPTLRRRGMISQVTKSVEKNETRKVSTNGCGSTMNGISYHLDYREIKRSKSGSGNRPSRPTGQYQRRSQEGLASVFDKGTGVTPLL